MVLLRPLRAVVVAVLEREDPLPRVVPMRRMPLERKLAARPAVVLAAEGRLEVLAVVAALAEAVDVCLTGTLLPERSECEPNGGAA